MLAPKKTKFRKGQKGRSRTRTVETRGLTLSFGSFGLQSLESAYVNAKQIEAVRKSISHFTKRGGKVWIRIFPDKPITQRPPELTMGGGKGSLDHYVFPVKPGRILFELDGLPEKTAREALTRASHKLPVKTRVVSRKV
jgi:large subunit ribosomal protein L16